MKANNRTIFSDKRFKAAATDKKTIKKTNSFLPRTPPPLPWECCSPAGLAPRRDTWPLPRARKRKTGEEEEEQTHPDIGLRWAEEEEEGRNRHPCGARGKKTKEKKMHQNSFRSEEKTSIYQFPIFIYILQEEKLVSFLHTYIATVCTVVCKFQILKTFFPANSPVVVGVDGRVPARDRVVQRGLLVGAALGGGGGGGEGGRGVVRVAHGGAGGGCQVLLLMVVVVVVVRGAAGGGEGVGAGADGKAGNIYNKLAPAPQVRIFVCHNLSATFNSNACQSVAAERGGWGQGDLEFNHLIM